ncbi:LTA synthase family protein [bacterium]|nr:LTA synthase family protein [bacterium]
MKEKLEKFLKSFKIQSKSYLKTNILFMTFVITSVINEILLRSLTVKNYFAIKPIIADIAVVLIIGSIGYFIKPKHQFKYFFGWSIFFTLLCLINSMYYTNYVSFASFSLLETSLQIVDVGDAVVQNVMELKDFCYLWQLLAMIFVNRSLKKKNYFEKVSKIEKGKVRAVNTLVVGLIFTGIFISTLSSVDISRLSKQWNREYIVMEFGAYTYQFNDLLATLKSGLNPLFGYDENAKEFREFYQNKEEQDTNEYTNIFEGKNVLVIHAESIQNFTLNTSFNGVDVAPNLKRLASEGIYFSNFYAEESVGTSSDTEFTFNTSLMPSSSGTVFISYYDRDYVTFPKLLKEKNYYTFSMHGNNCTFWNRQATHKSFGYNNFYCYTKDFTIDETIGLGLSDKSFFKQAVPKIKTINENNQNWYGLLIMLSNHTPFTDIENYSDYKVTMKYLSTNPETGEQEEKEAPYMEGTKLGSYFKSVHYADEALGELLDQMDQEGLLDNTVVVIYGDHDAKLKKSEFDWFYNYNPETNSTISSDDPNYHKVDYYDYELNRKVPFIIWTKNSKGDSLLNREVTEATGMYNVLPTFGNMIGVKSKYALGKDIFSLKNGEENFVPFPDGNWVTNKMYYNQSKGEYKILDNNATISEDYTSHYTKLTNQYISISNSIIVYDLIKKENEKEGLINEK